MRSAKAIFIRQARDVLKNRIVLIQFIIIPIMAFIMTELIAKQDDAMPNNIFVTMFAAMFSGMTPLMITNTAISEDREQKSLRFLVMAGVKPYEYLLGIGGFVLTLCSLVSAVFALIGGFKGMEFFLFTVVLIFGCAASALLGATIGILSKNQQAASAVGTPVFMVLALSPMLSVFNETIRKAAYFLYTYQVNMLVSDFSAGIVKPLLIILANIVVLIVLFVIAYKRKGLRG